MISVPVLSVAMRRSRRRCAGENPQLIKTFYRLLAEGLYGDIRADLERLLDEFAPHFKSISPSLCDSA